MPFDGWSVLAIIIATSLLSAAAWLARRSSARVALILAAAIVIRVDAAAQRGLHSWDERFHALVARNLIEHPLKPMLYARPAVAYDERDWTANHVWLHKPPLALWLMAGSMGSFGRYELALRLPSLLLGVAGVLLTGAIGARLFGTSAGLFAAGVHAANGFLVSLGAGRRVADHVDTLLIVCIEAAVWCALTASRRSRHATTVGVGVALGAALLTKAWPALLILPVCAVIWWSEDRWSRLVTRLAAVTLLGGAIAGLWLLYTLAMFPEEARWSSIYMLRHMTEIMEGQAGPWWSYVVDAPRFFGELVWIPVGWFLLRAVSAQASVGHRALAAWILIPYIVFSAVATKMPAFVMIAAPAIFVAQAAFWIALRDRWRSTSCGAQRLAFGTLLVLLALLPGRYLLEPTGPFERRDRSPAVIEALRSLDDRLGADDAVIFNLPQNIEAMFYSRYTVYARLPLPGEIEQVRDAGRRVIVHQPGGTTVDLPASPGVVVLDVLTP